MRKTNSLNALPAHLVSGSVALLIIFCLLKEKYVFNGNK